MDLDWSDDDEDPAAMHDPARSRYVARYDAAKVDYDDDNSDLRSEQAPEIAEALPADAEHDLISSNKLRDHKRSYLFSGNVKLKKEETQIAQDIERLSRQSTGLLPSGYQTPGIGLESPPSKHGLFFSNLPSFRSDLGTLTNGHHNTFHFDEHDLRQRALTRQSTYNTQHTYSSQHTARTTATTATTATTPTALTPAVLQYYGADVPADLWHVLLALDNAVDVTSGLVRLGAMRDIVRWFRHVDRHRGGNRPKVDINEGTLWKEVAKWDADDWLSYDALLQMLQRHSSLSATQPASKESATYKATHTVEMAPFHVPRTLNRCCAHTACQNQLFCSSVGDKNDEDIAELIATSDGVFRLSFLSTLTNKRRRKQQLRTRPAPESDNVRFRKHALAVSHEERRFLTAQETKQLLLNGSHRTGNDGRKSNGPIDSATNDQPRRDDVKKTESILRRTDTGASKRDILEEADDDEESLHVRMLLDTASVSSSQQQLRSQGSEEDSADVLGAAEDEEFSRRDLFRLEVAYARVLASHPRGRLTVGDVTKVMQEAGIKHDLSQVAADSWRAAEHLLITSLDDALALMQRIRWREVQIVGPLAHLIQYPVPVWLQQEFSAAEILLYQHHFMLIDLDHGGSIDAEELMRLLNALCAGNSKHNNNNNGAVAEDDFERHHLNANDRSSNGLHRSPTAPITATYRVSLEEAAFIVSTFDLDGTNSLDFVEFLVLIYRLQRGTMPSTFTSSPAGSLLVQAIHEAKRQLHLFEEIEEVAIHPLPGCNVLNFGGSPVSCTVALQVTDTEVEVQASETLLASRDKEEAGRTDDEVSNEAATPSREGPASSGDVKKKRTASPKRRPASGSSAVAPPPPPRFVTIQVTLHDGYPYRAPEVMLLEPGCVHPLLVRALDGSCRMLHLQRLWRGLDGDLCVRDLAGLLTHLQSLLCQPSAVWTPERCIDWLPEDMRRVYRAWQHTWATLVQRGDEVHENVPRRRLYTAEELCGQDGVIVDQLRRLPRLQQLHMSTLLVYLQDRLGQYRALGRSFVHFQRTTE